MFIKKGDLGFPFCVFIQRRNKLKERVSQKGFTLVEMMIAIAIIGVLAAITVPNFKKYQAKAKTSEAKIQLAMIYTSQEAFYQLFDMYATCLDYMGFDATNEQPRRYYALGFVGFNANIDQNFYNSAVGERLVTSECPRDLGETPGVSVFLAGKAVGSAMIDDLAKFQAAVDLGLTHNDLNDDPAGAGPFSEQAHSGLGTQTNMFTKVYTATAAGIIDSTKMASEEASLWTINHKKQLRNYRAGY